MVARPLGGGILPVFVARRRLAPFVGDRERRHEYALEHLRICPYVMVVHSSKELYLFTHVYRQATEKQYKLKLPRRMRRRAIVEYGQPGPTGTEGD
ncbi:MAG: hypothetical protein H6945_19075 [Zoogloeaceae bacterium]|nr:hypothetical protein [Rhodocyclaceae bacterium]MCP5237839.1 hypothetical protein [Zoogloeaceae bacterium]